VYPLLDDTAPALAVAASLVAGIAYKAATNRAFVGIAHLLRLGHRRAPARASSRANWPNQ
jgi:hypothetical protein